MFEWTGWPGNVTKINITEIIIPFAHETSFHYAHWFKGTNMFLGYSLKFQFYRHMSNVFYFLIQTSWFCNVIRSFIQVATCNLTTIHYFLISCVIFVMYLGIVCDSNFARAFIPWEQTKHQSWMLNNKQATIKRFSEWNVFVIMISCTWSIFKHDQIKLTSHKNSKNTYDVKQSRSKVIMAQRW